MDKPRIRMYAFIHGDHFCEACNKRLDAGFIVDGSTREFCSIKCLEETMDKPKPEPDEK